jgi:hypothetical protein
LKDSYNLTDETVIMPSRFLIFFFALCATSLSAQQAVEAATVSGTVVFPVQNLPYDPAKVALAVDASFYHPDDLTSLDCTLSIDWPAFFNALKMVAPADRLKVLAGLKIKSRAVRAKVPEFTFDWTSGTLDTSEQFVSSFKQKMGGFYQMYWPMIAAAPIKKAAEISKIEPLPNGSAKVYSSSQNVTVVMTIDGDSLPTHYSVESPVMKGTIDPHYVASPQPISGDLRRISSMDMTQQIGTSTMNIKLNLDYQEVDGFYVPEHVTFDLVGAYSIAVDFSACAISKVVAASK